MVSLIRPSCGACECRPCRHPFVKQLSEDAAHAKRIRAFVPTLDEAIYFSEVNFNEWDVLITDRAHEWTTDHLRVLHFIGLDQIGDGYAPLSWHRSTNVGQGPTQVRRAVEVVSGVIANRFRLPDHAPPELARLVRTTLIPAVQGRSR